jgi:sterol 3beta-glucosyltransferase
VKITLVGYGSRGDVQPYACLGWELRKRGHEVRLCAPRNLRGFAERLGLEYFPLPFDAQQLLSGLDAQRMLAKGDFVAFMKWLDGEAKKFRVELFDVLLAAAEGTDGIVSHGIVDDLLAALGTRFQIPVVPFYFYPVAPSRTFPALFLTNRSLGPLNWVTHWLLDVLVWRGAKEATNQLRARLGMPPAKRAYTHQVGEEKLLAVMSYSPLLFPRPADWWDEILSCPGIAMPGDMRDALGERGLEPELEAWLTSGPPPVYLGFGSIPVLEPRVMLTEVRRVLERLDLRAVISAGWSDVAEASDERIHLVGAVDHEALLPRCRAAVHHGGAGTTYATLRAGIPTLICAVFGDQPFWGSRVEKLGIGSTFRFQKWSEERFEKGLRTLLRPEVIDAARELGVRARTEDGLLEVTDAVLRAIEVTPPPH